MRHLVYNARYCGINQLLTLNHNIILPGYNTPVYNDINYSVTLHGVTTESYCMSVKNDMTNGSYYKIF
jgi:hypothetical protein